MNKIIKSATAGTNWRLEHWKKNQLFKIYEKHNIIPNQFSNHWLDVTLGAATAYATWYVMLYNDNHTPAVGDTYATPGFTESTDFTGERKVWTDAGATSQSITNSASKASFTMGGTDDIYGAALANVSTAGDTAAAAGVLGPVVKFTSVIDNIDASDVLKIYITVTATNQD